MSSLSVPIGTMSKPELRRLSEWYQLHQRVMPWRGEEDPYKIWVSEMMLQQTQVKTVISYYHRWLKAFPTVTDLAKASEQSVLKQWEGLGYYARARNFHRAAKIVVDLFDGHIPKIYEEFIALPGVGPYAAAAVLSIAHGAAYAVVDGNVKRVFSRYFGFPHPIELTYSGKWFSQVADETLRRRIAQGGNAGDHNQSVMELGATICKPKKYDCVCCPLKRNCVARKNNAVHEFPKRKLKKKLETKGYVALVIISENRVLLRQRAYGEMLAGLWDFPQIYLDSHVKLTAGSLEDQLFNKDMIEDSVSALGFGKTLSKVIAKELKSSAISAMPIRHAYTHFKIELWPAIVQLSPTYAHTDVGICRDKDDYRWEEITTRELPMPKSAIKVWHRTVSSIVTVPNLAR